MRRLVMLPAAGRSQVAKKPLRSFEKIARQPNVLDIVVLDLVHRRFVEAQDLGVRSENGEALQLQVHRSVLVSGLEANDAVRVAHRIHEIARSFYAGGANRHACQDAAPSPTT